MIFESVDNILLVDKPAGMSSFRVVSKIRGTIRTQIGTKLREETGLKKIRVGHTGTLDPFATGLLIILTGKNTKLSDEFLKKDKEYIATVKLGFSSTTDDPEGEIVPFNSEDILPIVPTEEEINEVLQKFTGEITQTPPIYSAIKIDGERAYKLARAGETPEMKPRNITIYDSELISYDYPFLTFKAHVSSGTYIRTLGKDIALALGTDGYLTELRRTKIADYNIEDAYKLEDVVG
ncbi:MAG: tRNA pseudouridine(55) synthase TruB [Bifidobacteriaceae bacterium]|jgi:tRNA pseudouridine55 synthase|nr:tRNA pseudouridine(55) synthase TruB [Bifidobacteriaceae bacterium]